FSDRYCARPILHSFPTRRSSDLQRFHVAERAPVKLLTGIGIPFPQNAQLLDGIQPAFFAEGDRQHVSVGVQPRLAEGELVRERLDRKRTRLNSSHQIISYPASCL